MRDGAIGVLARIVKRLDRRHSDAARGFLRQALGPTMKGEELEARVLQAWRHLFRVTLDTERFHAKVDLARIRERYTISLSPDIQRVLREKRGCIIITPHVGDWEAGSALLPWLGFDPLYVVSRPPRNRPLSLHAQHVRERRGTRLLPRRGAMKHAGEVIAAGGGLALMLDQRARKRPVLAPLFGRMATCDRSAGVLMRRLRAPIVFGGCYLTERPFHWDFSMDRVIWPEESAGKSPEEIATRVNQEIERLILKHPEQYFWLHERYRGA
jgi:KDO2-lipid IV(A) lauroyltransferase